MVEPLIHSHEMDGLLEEDPRANKDINCDKCGELVHCYNNECMQTWIETYRGNFCTKCMPITEVLEIPWVEPFLSQA